MLLEIEGQGAIRGRRRKLQWCARLSCTQADILSIVKSEGKACKRFSLQEEAEGDGFGGTVREEVRRPFHFKNFRLPALLGAEDGPAQRAKKPRTSLR